MWRIATAASRGLLSSRGATPNLMPDRSIPSRFEGIAGDLATLRFARGLQAAVDPRIDHLASVGSTFSSAASSPEIAAEVVGSLGLASSSIAHKAREFSEGIRHYGRCYWELSKARLSMLVVATSGAGFVLGSSSSIDLAGLCCTCAGTMMVAASANSLNQVFERQNDSKMKRTRQRPLPSGRIGVPHAAMWASSVGLAGTILLAWKANYLAAGLAASNLVLYAFVYTPLKQIHPINTWVGAVVGAIPPLLGWAAASGEVSLNSMILPAALYYWQIPHFMALAYLCRDDYITGGFRMFTLADASGQRTALVSLRNCLYLLPLGFLAYDWGLTSKWFALESTLVTMGISIGALLFVRDRSSKNARRMFHGSLIYLPVFMSALLLHRLPNEQNEMTMAEPTRNDEVLTETEIVASEGSSSSYKKRKGRSQTGPPIAYASVAPFPFLPAPMYFPSDS
ncbi:protoheme IX farnesyltransferase, mitochondrial-like [Zingiber officinale]|uniref:protoheme IX farnesyltransferase, mitochondrial-like n=1 Tax=Zingiber officinale TaxID=94328 RepID=UPI001C4BBAF1|nr:protoheme IX farnesyltransferase, mitochondrial-like [Zingiber officinale]